jgi:hypothetical protein
VRFDVGAGHGLRFGRNVLVVRAERGRYYTRVLRVVRVGRGGPLVGAGVSRQTTLRRAVRLGSGATLAARGGALRYQWRIVRAPRASRARIGNPGAARPLFRPDLRGRYVLRQFVQEAGGGTGSEDVTVTAAPISEGVRSSV